MIPKVEPTSRTATIEPEPPRAASPPTVLALKSAIDRIEEVVRIETTGLDTNAAVDFQDLNRRKSQCLLELTRISRVLPREGVDEALLSRISALREQLQKNQELLQVHLSATQEISRVLTVALGEAESDGTYSREVQVRPGDAA
jgi:hypothetical protein